MRIVNIGPPWRAFMLAVVLAIGLVATAAVAAGNPTVSLPTAGVVPATGNLGQTAANLMTQQFAEANITNPSNGSNALQNQEVNTATAGSEAGGALLTDCRANRTGVTIETDGGTGEIGEETDRPVGFLMSDEEHVIGATTERRLFMSAPRRAVTQGGTANTAVNAP